MLWVEADPKLREEFGSWLTCVRGINWTSKTRAQSTDHDTKVLKPISLYNSHDCINNDDNGGKKISIGDGLRTPASFNTRFRASLMYLSIPRESQSSRSFGLSANAAHSKGRLS